MKKNIIKTFSFMFIAMLLSKVLGLVRGMVFANFYGTGYEATAFFTASRIPLQLLDISLGAAISSTFIPVFNEYLQKKGKETAIKFSNNFLNIVIIISTVLTIVGILFAPNIVRLIAPDLDGQTFTLTVSLIKILFPMMILTAVTYVFVGFLQSFDEFNIPAIISLLSNVVLIGYLVLFNNKFGIMGVAIAMMIGWATQILIQIPSIRKKGFRYQFFVNFKDEGIRKIVFLALPILISTWVQPINNIVNIRLASGLEGGKAVPAIEYAYTLYLIIVGVFSYTLSNIIFPELSKLSADKQKDKFVGIMNRSVKISVFFIVPLGFAIALLSQDIIRLIYERGEFDAVSTMLTGNALLFYAIGMLGYGILEILNKAFYATQDAKTPMKVSFVAILLNVFLSIVLVNWIGYIGLPLAASITSIVNGILLTYFINKKNPGIVDRKTGIGLLKVFVAAGVMAIVVALLNCVEFPMLIIKLGVIAIVGLSVYFGMTYLLKVEEAKYTVDLIKSKLLRRKQLK